jgi:hypothetical protein
MRATLIVLLSSAFLAVGCKQGPGDRCVQNSDCSTGMCLNVSVQGGHCASSSSGATDTGTGGSEAEGGSGAEGGAAGQAGAGGSAGQAGEAGAAGQGGAGQGGSGIDASVD